MLRTSTVLMCLALLIGGGCTKRAAKQTSAPSTDNESKRNYASVGIAGTVSAASRYLAVRHKLIVEAPRAEVPRSLDSVIVFCGTIQCEVISSNVTSLSGDSVPSGSVSLRVRPGDVDKLIAFVGEKGKIAQHTTEQEDKTTIVVDTDAKIKNLTDFRDTLRKMLGRPGMSVKDIVEIQEKLTDAQSQLDSEVAQRKILANETEKVAIDVEFRSERTLARASAFKPIWDAVRESASVLAESVASLITAIVTVIPWIILVIPGWWCLARVWRRSRQKPAGEPAV